MTASLIPTLAAVPRPEDYQQLRLAFQTAQHDAQQAIQAAEQATQQAAQQAQQAAQRAQQDQQEIEQLRQALLQAQAQVQAQENRPAAALGTEQQAVLRVHLTPAAASAADRQIAAELDPKAPCAFHSRPGFTAKHTNGECYWLRRQRSGGAKNPGRGGVHKRGGGGRGGGSGRIVVHHHY